jgi:tetratricopeptide (TPR) repeat protein
MLIRPRLLTTAILLSMLLMLVATIYYGRNRVEPKLPAGITAQEYRRAREAFELKYRKVADEIDVLSWIAERKVASNDAADAISCFAAIPTAHPKYGHLARYQQGQILLKLHRAVEAEQQFRQLIAAEEVTPLLEPRLLISARGNLRHILEVELRFEERHRLLKGVIERGEEDPFEAVVYCFPTVLRWNGPESILWLEQFHATGPHSPWLEIALGRYRTGQGRLDEALPILERVHQEEPTNLHAAAALITCLQERGDLDGASELLGKLPPQSEEDPWQLLTLRGSFALQEGNADAALVAYEQMLRQVRTCTEAWQGVAQGAQLKNDVERRAKALGMVAALGRIQNHLGKPLQNAEDPNSFLDVADLCNEYNLLPEGALMVRAASLQSPQHERVLATRQAFRERLANAGLPALLGP